jgi:cytochrome c oxidase accessory protein FixG
MYEEIIEDTEEYRDHLSTIDSEGKRVWLYPKKPKGRFYNARTWVSVAFLAIFLTLPFIKVNGEQFFMLNVIERKFVIFGLLFSPHDFYLFFLLMLTFLVFIILFTVVWGRLFCGWVCPQTVFMEMIFRKIEYWIEGDANDQRRLDKLAWTPEKIRKKGLKHAIFFLIAVVVANYFLAYIIGMDEVLKIIKEPVTQHVGGFTAMIVFSFLFYGVFARLREQVCTTICPYGRLQSVLLVPDSIVVAYDNVRGEPRGKIKKQKNPLESIQAAVGAAPQSEVKKLGDCIDCKLCIAVCPTGIDIRNGTQLECTNCTACIDVCDEVMDKVERPRGLIRYDSLNGIKNGKRRIWTPRSIAYSGVLGFLMLIDVFFFMRRSDVSATILRSPGQMYQQVDETHIANLYTYQIVNKTHNTMPLTFKIKDDIGKIRLVGSDHPKAEREKMAEGAFFVDLPTSQLRGLKTEIEIQVYTGEKQVAKVKTSFVGPMTFDDDDEHHEEKREDKEHKEKEDKH